MLLLSGDGKLEPQVQNYYRIRKNWHRQLLPGQACNVEVQEYWPVAMRDKGRIKGPLHLVARVLQAADLEAPGPWTWHLPDWPNCDIRALADFNGIALEVARRAVWISLAKTRKKEMRE